MNMRHIILAAGAALALTACGSSSPATMAPPPAPSATPSVDAATAGRVCAAANALEFAGHSGADIIATAAKAYNITQAQVVYAIDHRCPGLKSIVPANLGT